MGGQATDGPWTGGAPDQGRGLPGLPAGFGRGGPWEAAVPSAVLAAALERAAGPDNLYDGAETDALVGIARQWAALESWAAAGKLADVRDGRFHNRGGDGSCEVFGVTPTRAFAHAKGDPFGATTHRF